MVPVRHFSHLRARQRSHHRHQRNGNAGLPPDVSFGGMNKKIDQRANGNGHGTGAYNQVRIRDFHHIQQQGNADDGSASPGQSQEKSDYSPGYHQQRQGIKSKMEKIQCINSLSIFMAFINDQFALIVK